MSLDNVVERLNKLILMNEKIPEDIRMLCIEKLTPDKERIFSRDREPINKKLEKRQYNSNEELKKDLNKVYMDLSWSHFRYFQMNGLDFSNVNFSASDLMGANLSGCKLSNADLSMCKLISTNLFNADIQNANLSMINCSNANFSSANLSMSRLHSCIALNADFSGANLSNCDFTNSILRNAKFERANTEGIILDNCIVEGTIFEGHQVVSEKEKREYEHKMNEIYQEIETAREYINSKSEYASESEYKTKKVYR